MCLFHYKSSSFAECSVSVQILTNQCTYIYGFVCMCVYVYIQFFMHCAVRTLSLESLLAKQKFFDVPDAGNDLFGEMLVQFVHFL